MSNYPNMYSTSWIANGMEWREVSKWNGRGYQSFLQVKRNGEWTGY